jgi:hypothetical protein
MSAMRTPGLIYRRAFPIDLGRIVVEEQWDISGPGCPMIKSPWLGNFDEGPIFTRQVIMTESEYALAEPPLFGPA